MPALRYALKFTAPVFTHFANEMPMFYNLDFMSG